MHRARRGPRSLIALLLAAALSATTAAAQVTPQPYPLITSNGHSRVADPKLNGGGAAARFSLSAGYPTTLPARADIYGPGGFVKTIWTGTLVPGAAPTTVWWDGKDALGQHVVTGNYTLAVAKSSGSSIFLKLRITVVRFGIAEIEFLDPTTGNDEWQMVYFKKNGLHGQFYATPAIGEYDNTVSADVSDADLNNGLPRPAVTLHTATDEPIMNGVNYATEQLNYPLAYERGAKPRLQATLCNGGTTVTGAAMSSFYPITNVDLRAKVVFPDGTAAYSGVLTPGASFTVDASGLPNDVSRTDWKVSWSWQYSTDGGATWGTVYGSHTTIHRFYTIWDDPIFQPGAVGTQYAGPWVEVADYVSGWGASLGISTATDAGLMEAFVKGFVGPFGGPPAALEGVIYDAFPLGGRGGANHYMGFTVGAPMELSAWLDSHQNGPYVNCSDNMAAQTTMLSMLGLPGLEPMRLNGGMSPLYAIWGIGSPGYTTDLWGPGQHSFSYHHIATRNGGVDISDTCLQVDEDGTPGSTPGLPGWNHDRPWAGVNGYDALLAPNTVAPVVLEGLIPSLF